jgi:4-hydroxy-tetrahydrodipicolinate synthase
MFNEIKGLWVPLITPFNEGKLDVESLVKLVKSIESAVDGFVPCLSSGEGDQMTEEVWRNVLNVVLKNTEKPVVAGILNPSLEKIADLSVIAKSLGCVAVAIPLQRVNTKERKEFCKEISQSSALPIILYNTEKINFDDVEDIRELSQYKNIVAIKDSSQNQGFFKKLVEAKKQGEVGISILQGMENQLFESAGCDGYLISLANVDPELCKEMFEHPSEERNAKIMEYWEYLNLASESWYMGIKNALVSKNVIKSAELIK